MIDEWSLKERVMILIVYVQEIVFPLSVVRLNILPTFTMQAHLGISYKPRYILLGLESKLYYRNATPLIVKSKLYIIRDIILSETLGN